MNGYVQWRRPRGMHRPVFLTTEAFTLAVAANGLASVVLYDPTRKKRVAITVIALGIDSAGNLIRVPQ